MEYLRVSEDLVDRKSTESRDRIRYFSAFLDIEHLRNGS